VKKADLLESAPEEIRTPNLLIRRQPSAVTGHFLGKKTASRNPKTTTTEAVGRGTSNKTTVNRSAATGRFVKESTAKRHPDTTISQRV
jgi:hypothetical protein